MQTDRATERENRDGATNAAKHDHKAIESPHVRQSTAISKERRKGQQQDYRILLLQKETKVMKFFAVSGFPTFVVFVSFC